MIPPPRPEAMANAAKPIGSNRCRRATEPPRIAFPNTPIRSSTASRTTVPAEASAPVNTRSSFLLPSLHCSDAPCPSSAGVRDQTDLVRYRAAFIASAWDPPGRRRLHGRSLAMVGGHTSAVVRRARRGILPRQLAPHPARWNVLIKQHVRCSRVDHQSALELSPLGAVPGEQQLIVAGQHCLAVGCEDGFAVAEQQ